MRSLPYGRHAVQSGLPSTFLAAFRALLFTVLLALALAAGPLVAHAALTAVHGVSSTTHLVNGMPPQLPCTGGLPGPC